MFGNLWWVLLFLPVLMVSWPIVELINLMRQYDDNDGRDALWFKAKKDVIHFVAIFVLMVLICEYLFLNIISTKGSLFSFWLVPIAIAVVYIFLIDSLRFYKKILIGKMIV
ncbi:MAG: hypothetical protein HGB12_10585 [Bacteroidetes bacterium]|nr:hypothetical protein [Bacteroidota bacterium]